ncbi:hypothetical protein FOZ62_029690 [Perkinsus olseni]|uniref:Uncharacterized protein n=1 Tax=Perkinsus olseni TaxID=32597 RepID=A0A7J6TPD0_PEROL|nr:hypothetical protein FOZ62_029690 [Perkinsus olseni]
MTIFVLALSALLCGSTNPLNVGSYRGGGAGISMLAIVNEDNYIDLVYSCLEPGKEATGASHFIAGSYPLKPGSGSSFLIDYDANAKFPRPTGIDSFYDQIKKNCPDAQVADGELTTVEFADRDSLIMKLGKQLVTLGRTGGNEFNIYRQNALFYYIEYLVITASYPTTEIFYVSLAKVDITVKCRSSSPVGLTSVGESFTSFIPSLQSGYLEFYVGLRDINSLITFQQKVGQECRLTLDDGKDWTIFTIVSPRTMFTQFQGQSVAAKLA